MGAFSSLSNAPSQKEHTTPSHLAIGQKNSNLEYLFESLPSGLWLIYPEVELLDHMVIIHLGFWETEIFLNNLFSNSYSLQKSAKYDQEKSDYFFNFREGSHSYHVSSSLPRHSTLPSPRGSRATLCLLGLVRDSPCAHWQGIPWLQGTTLVTFLDVTSVPSTLHPPPQASPCRAGAEPACLAGAPESPTAYT